LERALKLTKVAGLSKVSREPLIVVVVGPTASGKTALALAIARRFGGEIVNCDSVAMYREFEIGTAKPSAAERAEVPHHLVDCVDPLADVSAGEYARQARQILREIALRENELRRRLPIVSGGTGLYLRALLEGLSPGPQRSEELRNKLAHFYAQRTLTKSSVTPLDCADAICWLVSDHATKTTGHLIPVDGGLVEAFLR